ncbi:uroporphyrinogen-III synthase [Desertibaculum subflavum]|uniref:uroporphyrinogen-III synthase n=1 Tax=Desertibaculum subflavum TaxID=2268458 RepID=UPI000E66F125
MARLLVTRPIEQAEGLAEYLRGLGHEILVEPMLRIRFLDEGLPPLDGVQALLLTSRNGAIALARATGRRDLRLIAVGDATAAEAQTAGFAQIESAHGDAAALIDYVARHLRPEDGMLLHISGFDVAVDVAGALAEKGFQADRAVLYEADVADALTPALRTALAERAIDGVLFHSPRAARTFAGLVEDAGLAARLRSVTAFALSHQVAEAIRHLDWQAIRVAEAPNEAALLALLEVPVALAGPPPVPPPAPRVSRLPGLFMAAVIGLIAGAAAAYGVVRWLVPATATIAPAPAATLDIRPLQQRLAELEQRLAAAPAPNADVDALTGRVAALEARPAPADASARLDQLAEQVRQLEARPAGGPGEAAAVTGSGDVVERLAALEQKVQSLAEPQAVPPELSERLEAVERQSKAVADRLAAAAPPAGEARRVALVLGVNDLTEQVMSGRPYAEALDQVETLLGEEKPLAAPLQKQAGTGVPTVAALRREFDAVARGVIEAAAAGEGDHWLDHVRGRLASLFVLRRTGEVPGEAPDAVVARAEARLQDGDLAGAVAEIGKLTGRAGEAAADWLRPAQARLDAEAALAALRRRTFEIARAGLR